MPPMQQGFRCGCGDNYTERCRMRKPKLTYDLHNHVGRNHCSAISTIIFSTSRSQHLRFKVIYSCKRDKDTEKSFICLNSFVIKSYMFKQSFPIPDIPCQSMATRFVLDHSTGELRELSSPLSRTIKYLTRYSCAFTMRPELSYQLSRTLSVNIPVKSVPCISTCNASSLMLLALD